MEKKITIIKRPPIVAVMGHVDHGKSTLLDYIRKSNTVESEHGGITQHLSAYEVEHKDSDGIVKRITFIDTPGHAAFSGMRSRTASIADVGILIISAEEGVKPQTIEAYKILKKTKTPFLIALSKIDRPKSNPDKVKNGLLANSIYVEGYGGDIPIVEISSLTGEGVDDLLSTLLLLSEMEEFTGDTSLPASGFIIESHKDNNRGNTAVLIIKNGTLSKGDYIVAEEAIASTRIMENFLEKPIKEATFSSPIYIAGFSEIPNSGAAFLSYKTKKEACQLAEEFQKEIAICNNTHMISPGEKRHIFNVIIKADVLGTKEVLEDQLTSLADEESIIKVISSGVGNINESDYELALSTDAIIVGFCIKEERSVTEINHNKDVIIEHFTVIYKLIEWVEKYKKENKPQKEVKKVVGEGKVIRLFNATNKVQTIGIELVSGEFNAGEKINIIHKDDTVIYGKIKEMQQDRAEKKKINTGDFGASISIQSSPIKVGDTITVIKKVLE